MTKAEALDMLAQYAEIIRKHRGPTRQYTPIDHAAGMPDRWPQDGSGSKAKAMRWLGCMQGVLWAVGVYELEELKQHSKNKAVTPPSPVRAALLACPPTRAPIEVDAASVAPASSDVALVVGNPNGGGGINFEGKKP